MTRWQESEARGTDRRASSHAGSTRCMRCTLHRPCDPATQLPSTGPWPLPPEHYKHATGGRSGLSFAQRTVPGSRGRTARTAPGCRPLLSSWVAATAKKSRQGHRHTGTSYRSRIARKAKTPKSYKGQLGHGEVSRRLQTPGCPAPYNQHYNQAWVPVLAACETRASCAQKS